jgi:hypothetical protein
MVRRLPLFLVLALVIAACTGTSEPTTTSGDSTTTSSRDLTTTSAGSSTSTTGRITTPSTEPDLSDLVGISDEVRAQLEDLIRAAQEIRDLPFLTPPQITVVSTAELEARVREEIEEDLDELPADEALYRVLGLLADTADLEGILLDLYSEQVAGFYDGDTGEIVVPTREDGLSVIQRGTMVHELVHALTDQHFGFWEKFRAMVDEDRLDEATAYQALIEGDATLAEAQWVRTLSQVELGEFLAESLSVDTTALDAAPRFLRESLFFPYDIGLGFVQTLQSGGDWSAVNDAYTTLADLPGSSEQVITPDDYTRDLAVAVDIPQVSLSGYELERTSVWGEQGFRTMLNQGSGVDTLAVAVDGWGGDSYHQWFDGENAAMLIVYQGDTQADVDELEDALLTYAVESVPEENFIWVDQSGGKLYFIAADVVEVGEQIRASVGLG